MFLFASLLRKDLVTPFALPLRVRCLPMSDEEYIEDDEGWDEEGDEW